MKSVIILAVAVILSQITSVFGGLWQTTSLHPTNHLPSSTNLLNPDSGDVNKRPRGLKLFWKEVEPEKKDIVTIRKRFTPVDLVTGIVDDVRYAVPQAVNFIVTLPSTISAGLKLAGIAVCSFMGSVASGIKSAYEESLPGVRIASGLNLAVYLAWIFLPKSFMAKYFVSHELPFNGNLVAWVKDVVRDPMLFTRLTSAFSHFSLMHLYFNMGCLLSYGNSLCSQLGSTRFLLSLMSAGVFSTLFNDLMTIGMNHVRVNFLKTAPLPPFVGLGFSGIAYTLIVLAASIRVPNKYISNEQIDSTQKLLRRSTLFESVMYLITAINVNKQRPLFAHGIHVSGTIWGFILSDWFYRTNKL
jgi:membrane associated rhomboid family serine protease